MTKRKTEKKTLHVFLVTSNHKSTSHTRAHFTVVFLVAKPLIWSEAEGDLVVIETSFSILGTNHLISTLYTKFQLFALFGIN